MDAAEQLKPYYKNLIWEAENFFVKKFVTSGLIEKELSYCLDVIFNITKSEDIDYNRGIIAFNEKYGQTKTFFFEIVSHRYRRLTGRNLFKKTSAKELVSIFKEHGEAELLKFINVKNLFIDDIGDEGEKTVSHFSNKINVLRFVLLKRYEMWEKSKGEFRTFGTTNLTIEEIAEVYDGRVSDRLLQMTYIRHFAFLAKGSFRQIKECRKLLPEEVRANWAKLQKPVVEERVDVIKYLNDLLTESDEYLNSMGAFNWNFVKRAMIENGSIKASAFETLPEDLLKMAEIKEREDARELTRNQYRHTTADIRSARLEEAYKAITHEKITDHAQALVTKRIFFTFRAKAGFKFKAI